MCGRGSTYYYIVLDPPPEGDSPKSSNNAGVSKNKSRVLASAGRPEVKLAGGLPYGKRKKNAVNKEVSRGLRNFLGGVLAPKRIAWCRQRRIDVQ